MEASASQPKKAFLTSKFQVGSSKSDKISYSFGSKVFHSGDVPKEVLEAKREVTKKKQANILGTEKREWNQTTIADHKIEKDINPDLKRQLLKVRAGLLDEKVIKPSKMHSEERILETQKFIVAMTGQGPIGKLTGKWTNMIDERGCHKHCIEDKWPDWNQSINIRTKEDQKDAAAVFQKKEDKRKKMQSMEKYSKLDKSSYINPQKGTKTFNDRLRERKIDFQDLKDQFKKELKVEFPNASEERLQAMAQRLLNEKLLADEKMSRFPVQHESFRPNVSLTTQDRRYRVFHHPGTWCWNEKENRYCWSCCMNFDENSPGCESKVVNPDAWCVLGYERYYPGREI